MVKDIFAIGMGFDVKWHDAMDMAIRVFQRKVTRHPALVRGGRTAVFHGFQKGVRLHGIGAASTAIPILRRNLIDAFMQCDLPFFRRVFLIHSDDLTRPRLLASAHEKRYQKALERGQGVRLDFEHPFDFNDTAQRQGADANRKPRVLPRFAKDIGHQV